ncbi:hypothetical protein DCE93_05110 [Agromyces badenianii]|uniref:Uncharacterized protein n=2 Tax=Agromyces badenianii TaxID=2080742 RepID=A0A2S0WV50_9MICO|nr:hypothetical protein DCE93_05110 [Agromyces badenianii]
MPRGIRSREETAMSGDGSEFEYPDTAGYPDGMGTLHEGTDDAATAAEEDLEEFALDEEEDVEGV